MGCDPAGWDGYKTVITYDKQHFGRLPDTSYADGVLTFSVVRKDPRPPSPLGIPSGPLYVCVCPKQSLVSADP